MQLLCNCLQLMLAVHPSSLKQHALSKRAKRVAGTCTSVTGGASVPHIYINCGKIQSNSLFFRKPIQQTPFKMLTPARTFAVRAGKAALHPATSFSAVTRPTLRTYVGQGTVTYNEYNAREAPHPLQWNKLLESDSGESALLYAPVFYEPDDADAFLDEISCYVSVRLQPFFCFLHF